MCVRVVETRKQQLLLGVDRARGWTSEFCDVLGRTDRDDSVGVNRYGFCRWLCRIHRMYDRVDDDGLGYERRLVSMHGKFHKTQRKSYDRNQQRWFSSAVDCTLLTNLDVDQLVE